MNSSYGLNLKHTTQLRILIVQSTKYTQCLVHTFTVPRNIFKVEGVDDQVSHFFEGEGEDVAIKTLDTILFFTCVKDPYPIRCKTARTPPAAPHLTTATDPPLRNGPTKPCRTGSWGGNAFCICLGGFVQHWTHYSFYIHPGPPSPKVKAT